MHTDHAGHAHQWMSAEYIRSIEEADAQIGRFLQSLKQEGLYKDTHFLFLSDHGGTGYGHGGLSTDEMIVPWGIAGPGIRKGMKQAAGICGAFRATESVFLPPFHFLSSLKSQSGYGFLRSFPPLYLPFFLLF